MNAVEIEQAITELAEKPFDASEFPFAFLEAFGNKATTLKRLRNGTSNKSDLGGVLQTGNIHILTTEPGGVPAAMEALRTSPATLKKQHKVRFILATDGQTLEAEALNTADAPVVCDYADFPNHFGFFLPLAGISTVEKIRENAFDIRATARLNKLYVKLLEENPDWGSDARRHDMNHFMARLIFCFFAEDTDIFRSSGLFTATVEQMSDDSNTDWVISEIFRAMNTKIKDRAALGLRPWADAFPYVNGEMFSGSVEVPKFSRLARRYLLHIGHLDWTQINPDIFGSMIQAVADEGERSALGMHYTSVPNILKVLNPLFLDDLRRQLSEAGDNGRKLLNLRKRMARIRVFDPACGSGNFLVIAYKQMRGIEAEVNRRRGELDRPTDIPLTNFRGIEIRDFSAEIARLALIIAEYQCDVLYRGQKEALAEFLPLDARNWITCGNALRLDWLEICPPTGTGAKVRSGDLFGVEPDQAEIDFENEGGETYICGNPPYLGDKYQNPEQKSDLAALVRGKPQKAIDYITGWIWKASEFLRGQSAFAFVTTNSINQGVQVPAVWPRVFSDGNEIVFAHKDFKWSNNAANNAGVIVSAVGVAPVGQAAKTIWEGELERSVSSINAYLVDGQSLIVASRSRSISGLPLMNAGNIPRDKGNFMLTSEEAGEIVEAEPIARRMIRRIVGSSEAINGTLRYCLWIDDDDYAMAMRIPQIAKRLNAIRAYREAGSERGKLGVNTPHRFERVIVAQSIQIVVPRVSSNRREFLPVDVLPSNVIVSDAAMALYDAPLWNVAILQSRLHLAWITTVCGKLKTDFRYSNTLGWNTFPVPTLTQKNRDDLTACAERILLTREAYFPATIADLYDPEKMPDDLRAAHDANDETLERIYIGRRFKNDTERLEHLFDRYTRMTAAEGARKRGA
ncbi:class I SAM-dependent DNA methyltransferase [Jannaschia formosa]|uniref:class I SAM-dependent DNA methyltransferase n=1 Tax=Jannaschia formosa TaxID=2259592 RepID=UPI000E1C1164|nr:DNA methyltransferase [Jannaschia formosa]TFL20276.1 class I SAM-dependent DNA methyltransferase [Jannaschia formosa]